MIKGSYIRLVNPERDTVGGYGQASDAYRYYARGRLALNVQYEVVDPDYGMKYYGDSANAKNWIVIHAPGMGSYTIDRRCFLEVKKKFKRNLPAWF
jgi:hypothetical protein